MATIGSPGNNPSVDVIYVVIKDYAFAVPLDPNNANLVFAIEPDIGSHLWALEQTSIAENAGADLRCGPTIFDPSSKAFDEVRNMQLGAWNHSPTFYGEAVHAIALKMRMGSHVLVP